MRNFGVMFRRALIDNRWGILWWGLGMGLLAMYMTVLYPLLSGIELINSLMDNPVFQGFMGGSEMDIATPEGFLSAFFFSWGPIILAIYAIMNASSMVAGEDTEGQLDILLSTPVPRYQVILEKVLAFVVIVTVIIAISMVFLFIGVAITPEMDLALGPVILANTLMIPVVLVIGAIALLLSIVLPSRSMAGGAAAGVIVASYFINSFAGMTDAPVLNFIQRLSIFTYFNATTIIRDGVVWGDLAVLIAVFAVFFGAALYFFDKKDIAA